MKGERRKVSRKVAKIVRSPPSGAAADVHREEKIHHGDTESTEMEE